MKNKNVKAWFDECMMRLKNLPAYKTLQDNLTSNAYTKLGGLIEYEQDMDEIAAQLQEEKDLDQVQVNTLEYMLIVK